MTIHREIFERYIQAWNETDPARRRALIEDIYADHAIYIDPMIDTHGWDGIDATIDAVQKMFPDHVFSLAGEVDAHHNIARFRWHLTERRAKEPLAIGFDVADLKDGRIQQVRGFLDKAP